MYSIHTHKRCCWFSFQSISFSSGYCMFMLSVVSFESLCWQILSKCSFNSSCAFLEHFICKKEMCHDAGLDPIWFTWNISCWMPKKETIVEKAWANEAKTIWIASFLYVKQHFLLLLKVLTSILNDFLLFTHSTRYPTAACVGIFVANVINAIQK